MRISVAIVASAVLLAGCGSTPQAGQEQRTITVLAAASLTEAFGALAKKFEADNPGVKIAFSFGSSADLAQQVTNGAPADVFAAANQSTMDVVTKAGQADGQPTVFATNTLRIAVPSNNPKGINGLADLNRDGVVLVVCAPQVPCGSATAKVSEVAGIKLKPVSEESDVKSVLGKVIAGEADAGLVYASDIKTAGGKVKGIDFPESAKAVNSYPITVVKSTKQAELAHKFLDLVVSGTGKAALADAGFLTS